MKVKDVIPLLQKCDPEAEFVVNSPYQGFMPVTVLHRRAAHIGVGPKYSIDEIPTVEPLSGDLGYMLSQGLDVIGV